MILTEELIISVSLIQIPEHRVNMNDHLHTLVVTQVNMKILLDNSLIQILKALTKELIAYELPRQVPRTATPANPHNANVDLHQTPPNMDWTGPF